MAWLRIDDGFTANAKIAQLTDAQFRVWVRLLCYCTTARDPTVDKHVVREVAGLDRRRIKVFHRLGLLDKIEPTSDELRPELTSDFERTSSEVSPEDEEEFGGDFEVHNWSKYLPKDAQNAARQARFRGRKRNADSNAEVTHEPSHARAGTRGVPSRPVPKEQEQPGAVPVARDPEPPLGNGRTAPDEEITTIGDTVEAVLKGAKH